MAKIVQFEDGTYGLRTYWLPFAGWHFATSCGRYSFSEGIYIDRHCKFSDIEAAMYLFNIITEKTPTKRHRVITPPPAS